MAFDEQERDKLHRRFNRFAEDRHPALGDEPGQSLGEQLGDDDERLTAAEDWLSLSPLIAEGAEGQAG